MNAFPGRRRTIVPALLKRVEAGGCAPPVVVEQKRSLCPKCNSKPNYFFHVKHCKG